MTWSSIDCVTCIYIYRHALFKCFVSVFLKENCFFHHIYNYVLTASAFPTSPWNFWNGVFPDHNWLTNFQTGQTTFCNKDVFGWKRLQLLPFQTAAEILHTWKFQVCPVIFGLSSRYWLAWASRLCAESFCSKRLSMPKPPTARVPV